MSLKAFLEQIENTPPWVSRKRINRRSNKIRKVLRNRWLRRIRLDKEVPVKLRRGWEW